MMENKENQIKELSLSIDLSMNEYLDIMKKCATHGLTLGELVECFISDLIDGKHSNGSDERMHVSNWFDRITHSSDSLLSWLLTQSQYDVKEFVEVYNDIDDLLFRSEQLKKGQIIYDEEDMMDFIGRINETIGIYSECMTDYSIYNPSADWEKEVENVINWYEEVYS